MVNKDVLYLKKANRSTIIKYKNQDEIVIDLLLETLLDLTLREDLTTLKGRLEATSKVYHIFKHVPIYLKENITLIQTNNKKEIDNIYINSYNIIEMVKDKKQTIIVFIDHSFLKIDKPYHLIKKYYDLILKIQKL